MFWNADSVSWLGKIIKPLKLLCPWLYVNKKQCFVFHLSTLACTFTSWIERETKSHFINNLRCRMCSQVWSNVLPLVSISYFGEKISLRSFEKQCNGHQDYYDACLHLQNNEPVHNYGIYRHKESNCWQTSFGYLLFSPSLRIYHVVQMSILFKNFYLFQADLSWSLLAESL